MEAKQGGNMKTDPISSYAEDDLVQRILSFYLILR